MELSLRHQRVSESRAFVRRRGIPISQAFTLAANRREQSDSGSEEGSGEMLTNINVLESPPRQGCPKLKMLTEYLSKSI